MGPVRHSRRSDPAVAALKSRQVCPHGGAGAHVPHVCRRCPVAARMLKNCPPEWPKLARPLRARENARRPTHTAGLCRSLANGCGAHRAGASRFPNRAISAEASYSPLYRRGPAAFHLFSALSLPMQGSMTPMRPPRAGLTSPVERRRKRLARFLGKAAPLLVGTAAHQGRLRTSCGRLRHKADRNARHMSRHKMTE